MSNIIIRAWNTLEYFCLFSTENGNISHINTWANNKLFIYWIKIYSYKFKFLLFLYFIWKSSIVDWSKIKLVESIWNCYKLWAGKTYYLFNVDVKFKSVALSARKCSYIPTSNFTCIITWKYKIGIFQNFNSIYFWSMPFHILNTRHFNPWVKLINFNQLMIMSCKK